MPQPCRPPPLAHRLTDPGRGPAPDRTDADDPGVPLGAGGEQDGRTVDPLGDDGALHGPDRRTGHRAVVDAGRLELEVARAPPGVDGGDVEVGERERPACATVRDESAEGACDEVLAGRPVHHGRAAGDRTERAEARPAGERPVPPRVGRVGCRRRRRGRPGERHEVCLQPDAVLDDVGGDAVDLGGDELVRRQLADVDLLVDVHDDRLGPGRRAARHLLADVDTDHPGQRDELVLDPPLDRSDLLAVRGPPVGNFTHELLSPCGPVHPGGAWSGGRCRVEEPSAPVVIHASSVAIRAASGSRAARTYQVRRG